MSDREIEVRFLEIDKESLTRRLLELKADDQGDDLLEEIIFYDNDLKWRDREDKFVRIRKNKKGVVVSYKHHQSQTVGGTEEIEFAVSDLRNTEMFLEKIGLIAYRHQQKRRHTFRLDETIVDIDTWPRIPTYVELEGPSEEALKRTAAQLYLNWEDAVFQDAGSVIQNKYKIPVKKMRWFTFDRFE